MKKAFYFFITMLVAITIAMSSCSFSKQGCPGQTDLKLKHVDVSSCKDRFEPEP